MTLAQSFPATYSVLSAPALQEHVLSTYSLNILPRHDLFMSIVEPRRE